MRNFLVTHAEFLGYSCGISWLLMRNFLVTYAYQKASIYADFKAPVIKRVIKRVIKLSIKESIGRQIKKQFNINYDILIGISWLPMTLKPII